MVKLGFAILFLVSATARADVDAFFAGGVLDVPWGSTLQQTTAAHPGGMVWPNKDHGGGEGHVYEAIGEFRALGLNYLARHVQFVFSRDNKLNLVEIHFSYADREEVLFGVAQVLGQNYETRDEKVSRIFAWKPGRHCRVGFVVSSDPNLPWAYLTVTRGKARD